MAPFGTLHTLNELIHPRSRLARAAAKIAGLELTLPPFVFGTTNKTPEYLAKFPLGKIPSFEGADGLLVTEGNAIASYIADSAPEPRRTQLLGASPAARAHVQQWWWFAILQMQPAVEPLTLWRHGYGTYDAAKEAEAVKTLKMSLDYLEGYLAGGRKWLVDSDGPSMADLAVGSQLYYAFMAYVDAEMRKAYPAAVEYYGRVSEVVELGDMFEVAMVDVRKEHESA